MRAKVMGEEFVFMWVARVVERVRVVQQPVGAGDGDTV